MDEQKYDLEDRLIDYSVRIIRLASKLSNDQLGNHMRCQILRSGTSPAANYGEAQSAESRGDFIHKLKICLKELRETKIWIKMIMRANLIPKPERLGPLLQESEELIMILHTSVKTTRENDTIKH